MRNAVKVLACIAKYGTNGFKGIGIAGVPQATDNGGTNYRSVFMLNDENDA
jgi:hypothetical protein